MILEGHDRLRTAAEARWRRESNCHRTFSEFLAASSPRERNRHPTSCVRWRFRTRLRLARGRHTLPDVRFGVLKEPGAVVPLAGSVRGATRNRRPYRDGCDHQCILHWAIPSAFESHSRIRMSYGLITSDRRTCRYAPIKIRQLGKSTCHYRCRPRRFHED